MRQGILLVLMLLVLMVAPRPSAPTPKPPPIKADKAVAHKPFTMPLPTPVRVITESYQALTPELVITPTMLAPVEQPKPVVAAAAPKPPSAKAEAKREYDICRGKGRSYYSNGRSWRCNR